MPVVSIPRFIRHPITEAISVYLVLLKVLVPAILIVKLLEAVGGIEWLGALLAPLMALLGLPDVVGIVWAATMLTSILTGMVIFASVAAEQSLNVAQITVLSTLMLLAHSLPVEAAVARRAGVPWVTTLLLRVGGAIILGLLVRGYYTLTGSGQALVSLDWAPEAENETLLLWLLSQVQMLIMVFFVILALIILLDVIRAIKLEQYLHRLLSHPLRMLGIGAAATNVVVIGLLLGLSFGAGLLIRDVDSGKMSANDSYLALCFLGLAHSVIDDTLLVMILGADVIVVVVVRLAFACLVVALLSHYLQKRPPMLS